MTSRDGRFKVTQLIVAAAPDDLPRKPALWYYR
jgi:hypothetical protein